MNVDLRRLQHLMALAEHGNFGRAASAVFLTQPALSRSIQALEREVGAPLVDRRTTGIELTDMGRLVLRHAISLDASARDLDREVRLTKDLALGELRVGFGPWAAASLVAPAVGALNRRAPTLRMELVVAPWREMPARLRARQIDVMIGGSSDVTESADIESVTLSTHGTVVVGRHDHPLAGIDDVDPHALFDHAVIGPGLDSGAADLLAGLATAAGLPPGTAPLTIQCDSADVLRGIVAESDALTVLPRFMVDEDVAAGRLAVITDIGLRFVFVAAWLRGRTLGPAGTALLDLLRA